MLQLKTSKTWAVQFDGLSDLVAWLENTPSPWPVSSQESRERGNAEWNGTRTFDEAVALARDGWEEGVKELFALAATIPNNRVVTKTYSVAGDYPDVGRAVTGDPFSMVRRGKAAKPKPAMTIVSAIGGTVNVTAKEMAHFGAAITALVDRLESRNVRVELLAHWGNSTWLDVGMGFTWKVKAAQDPLDLSAVAFSLGHAAAMRRLGFAAMERYPKVVSGYGHTLHTVDPKLIVDLPADALLIKGVQASRGACRTMTGALEYATKVINDAAKKLGHEAIAELEEL